ncbi:Hypp5047 [Branchiostoma lanceolatum]|uniref:Hypp5047 protein n=1 Tax=Branchiostoma lanceolatum TaxID=7740 RepID=A0A8K0ABX7_BRALA|nr:Hypp5047 [Branchiostoma lanceolatum]
MNERISPAPRAASWSRAAARSGRFVPLQRPGSSGYSCGSALSGPAEGRVRLLAARCLISSRLCSGGLLKGSFATLISASFLPQPPATESQAGIANVSAAN